MRLLAAILIVIVAATPHTAMAEQPKTALAFTAFDFTDTSGEVRDQRAEHERRLGQLVERLKQELEKSDRFDFTEAACADNQCRSEDTLDKARAEDKRFVVFGSVQKTSSLVLWAKVDVVDSQTSKVVFTRWITFRGDTDESWARTGRFVGRAMIAATPPGQ